MGIRVVLPGWVDKCRESDKKSEEGDFLVTSGFEAIEAAAAAISFSKCPSSSSKNRSNVENSSATNDHLSNLRSSSFQNLQLNCAPSTVAVGDHLRSGRRSPSCNGRCSSCSSTKTSQICADCSAPEVDCECRIKQVITCSPRSNSYIEPYEGGSYHSLIPLPSYREHNSGVLPAELKVHRRSERICDLDGEVSASSSCAALSSP